MKSPASEPVRLASLDAYRGLVMLAMASGGLGLYQVASHYPESRLWQAIGHQFEHVPWVGCTLWDLIQPSFMFLVGVSLAYSCAHRAARGDRYVQLLRHAAVRSLVLILLGIFLRSRNAPQTNFTFEDVLTQIGLGYLPLFLLWGRRPAVQWGVAWGLLIGYWCWFYFWPLPAAGFDYQAFGLPPDWEYLTGTAAHWEKSVNPAAAFDRWFLNLFPRTQPFVFNAGGYQTLNFIPALSTMIFGLLAGELLRGPHSPRAKLARLVVAGAAGLAAGWVLDRAGLCPIVKRIWTPSWTLFSTGWTLLILAAFSGLVDVGGWRRWTLPLRVAGANSILMYCLAVLLPGWIQQSLQVHLGPEIFRLAGVAWEPLCRSLTSLAAMWLFCYWLWRQRIFLRI